MSKREQLRGGVFCLVAATVLLMICSMNSWLYPVNSWVDVNILTTVGRGMFNGMLPYRDLVDHKGPLIYFLFGLCTVINPGGYHALFVLELLAVAGAMFFGWKTICLYVPKASPVWMAPLAVALSASKTFVCGGSAEEFMLLPFAWSLYDLLACWRRNERMRAGALLKNGFLAGCVLCVKFNLLSVHFAWMAMLALNTLYRGRRVVPVLKMCLTFLAGMALACLPWIVWFAAQGALGELISGYLVINLFGYGADGAPLLSALLSGVRTLLEKSPLYFVLLAIGGISVIAVPRSRMAVREKALVLSAAALLALSVYSRMTANVYYGVVFLVFLPFALLPLNLMKAGVGVPVWCRRAAAVAVLCACAVYAYCTFDYACYIGTRYEETPQAQIAAAVRARGAENSTMQQYYSMDCGLYYAADVWPADKLFTLMNIRREEFLALQDEMVARAEADFVVVWQPEDAQILSFERYEPVFEMLSNYGSEFPERTARFTLYERAAD